RVEHSSPGSNHTHTPTHRPIPVAVTDESWHYGCDDSLGISTRSISRTSMHEKALRLQDLNVAFLLKKSVEVLQEAMHALPDQGTAQSSVFPFLT
ncbi:hypothetical protein, partial [Bifidobacterium sp.]|uniref:hypothetical protein n=1 Tax=Bifidobacterium sp. TaxID=41200 RepID=UPI0039ECDF8B